MMHGYDCVVRSLLPDHMVPHCRFGRLKFFEVVPQHGRNLIREISKTWKIERIPVLNRTLVAHFSQELFFKDTFKNFVFGFD